MRRTKKEERKAGQRAIAASKRQLRTWLSETIGCYMEAQEENSSEEEFSAVRFREEVREAKRGVRSEKQGREFLAKALSFYNGESDDKKQTPPDNDVPPFATTGEGSRPAPFLRPELSRDPSVSSAPSSSRTVATRERRAALEGRKKLKQQTRDTEKKKRMEGTKQRVIKNGKKKMKQKGTPRFSSSIAANDFMVCHYKGDNALDCNKPNHHDPSQGCYAKNIGNRIRTKEQCRGGGAVSSSFSSSPSSSFSPAPSHSFVSSPSSSFTPAAPARPSSSYAPPRPATSPRTYRAPSTSSWRPASSSTPVYSSPTRTFSPPLSRPASTPVDSSSPSSSSSSGAPRAGRTDSVYRQTPGSIRG